MKKLNHPPFNDWLLSEEKITPEQAFQLQEHINSCQECSQASLALSEVKYLIRSTGQVKPAEGFTTRWQKRLSIQREERKRKNAWILFGVAAGMAVTILSFLVWRIYGLFDSPAVILSSLVYLWTFSQVVLTNLNEFFHITFRFLPSISILGLIFFTGFCSLVSVLWFVTVRKLTLGGRVASW